MKAVFKSGAAAGRAPSSATSSSTPMGDIIFSEGEIGNEMFILQSGTVELIKTIAGETKVLATLERATSSAR